NIGVHVVVYCDPNMNLALPDVSPEELAALRAQVQALRSEADRQAREIRELESAVKVERLAHERAEAKLKDLLRRLYGPKSEQLSADQLQLLFETLQADEQLRLDAPAAGAVATKQEKKKSRKVAGAGRRLSICRSSVSRLICRSLRRPAWCAS